jgi:F0F1-type ATP synthase gamma subunit
VIGLINWKHCGESRCGLSQIISQRFQVGSEGDCDRIVGIWADINYEFDTYSVIYVYIKYDYFTSTIIINMNNLKLYPIKYFIH